MADPSFPKAAEVVIIGGGGAGCSIAYFLGLRGIKAVVLEREKLWMAGSTGKAAGGRRDSFSTEINIKLSTFSTRWYKEHEDLLTNAGFMQTGYLFLYSSEESCDDALKDIALQNSLGVPSRIITPQEAQEIVPDIYIDDLLAASYCPTDGLFETTEIGMLFMKLARSQGAIICNDCPVTGIEVKNDKIMGVHTSCGFISTPIVVNAAGAWSKKIGEMAGVIIPADPYRRQIWRTANTTICPHPLPFCFDFDSGLYWRREGVTNKHGLLLSWTDPAEPSSDSTITEQANLEAVIERALRRIPRIAEVNINTKQSWAGLYCETKDHHIIYDNKAGPKGFILACGCSGHGVMHFPATGKVVSEMIVDGTATTIDVSCLSLNRKLIKERIKL